MNKITNSLVLGSVLAASTLMSGATMAELSGNVSANSMYVWRGVQQSTSAAVQGGIDFADKSGIYAGAWTSSLDLGTELDLYVGYAGEISGIGYDVGYISYRYDQANEVLVTDLDFEEVYVGISYNNLSALYSYDSENENSYLEGAIDIEVAKDLSLNIHVGSYSFDVSANDYNDYSLTLGKTVDGWDWSYGVSKSDIDDTGYITNIAIGKSFDL